MQLEQRIRQLEGRNGGMIVMPSNNTGFDAGVLFGKHPGRLAQLQDPVSPKAPRADIPWALDNGIFGAFTNGKKWSEEPLYRYLDDYAAWKPLWVVVPDWVGDRDETLRRWDQHAPAIQAFGVPLAMAVQDGMTPSDVPKECAVVFVGGSTSWKWRNLTMWTSSFPRVHVGRVNTIRLLLMAENAGAESCDGTGWFRDPKRTMELDSYLSHNHNHPDLWTDQQNALNAAAKNSTDLCPTTGESAVSIADMSCKNAPQKK